MQWYTKYMSMLSNLTKLEPFQQDSGDPKTGETENICCDALNQEYKHLSSLFHCACSYSVRNYPSTEICRVLSLVKRAQHTQMPCLTRSFSSKIALGVTPWILWREDHTLLDGMVLKIHTWNWQSIKILTCGKK